MFNKFDAAWRAIHSTFKMPTEVSDEWLQRIIHNYSGPSRFYHNLVHIDEMCGTLGQFLPYLSDEEYAELLIAAIFHDFIYEAGSPSNEDLSASAARSFCAAFHFGAGPNANAVVELILDTKSPHKPREGDIRSMALVDADLLRFASESEVHNWNIRKEFILVPEKEYIEGRLKFLSTMLNRQPFFYTNELSINSKAARDNVKDSMDRLLSTRLLY